MMISLIPTHIRVGQYRFLNAGSKPKQTFFYINVKFNLILSFKYIFLHYNFFTSILSFLECGIPYSLDGTERTKL